MFEHYYRHNKSYRPRRALRRLVWTVCGLFFVGILGLLVLFLANSLFIEPEPVPATSNVQTSVQAPSIKVFRTAYFQFQAGDTWTEDAKQTTDTTFVYRSYRGPLVEHDLTIYVNTDKTSFDATRVQPVKLEPDGTFNLSEKISRHCRSVLPKAQQLEAQTIVFRDVRFRCDADDTIFAVLVGRIGGTPLMELLRPDGQAARYTIYYRDLTAGPTGRELTGIVNSFQTR